MEICVQRSDEDKALSNYEKVTQRGKKSKEHRECVTLIAVTHLLNS